MLKYDYSRGDCHPMLVAQYVLEDASTLDLCLLSIIANRVDIPMPWYVPVGCPETKPHSTGLGFQLQWFQNQYNNVRPELSSEPQRDVFQVPASHCWTKKFVNPSRLRMVAGSSPPWRVGLCETHT